VHNDKHQTRYVVSKRLYMAKGASLRHLRVADVRRFVRHKDAVLIQRSSCELDGRF
jgi:hypothetical protein